jgi:Flavodoxin
MAAAGPPSGNPRSPTVGTRMTASLRPTRIVRAKKHATKGVTVKIAVVYESLYGNTFHIAEAVADGLKGVGEVSLVNVCDADPALAAGLDLLVVGGPTHVHGMSSRLTRKNAAADAEKRGHTAPDVAGMPVRDWLEGLPSGDGRAAAAFDTRADKPKVLVGSAAKGIAKRLRGRGFDVVGEESFLVGGLDGPLQEGEVERARAWAEHLVAVGSRSG